MMGESSLAALQWRRPSCVPSEKTASGRRSLMPSFVNSREFSLIPREFRASVPPCTAPAALYFQGDPQNRRGGGGGGVTYGKRPVGAPGYSSGSHPACVATERETP